MPVRIRVVIPPSFKKRLDKKDQRLSAAITECMQRVLSDPRSPGLNVHRIQGTRDVWEAYVDEGNRLTFRRTKEEIEFLNHCNHDILRRA